MELQQFLRERGLTALCEEFAIKAKRHPQYPNLVLLKYSQIESPMGEKVVQQCRGIILDEANDWAVVARPYDKFFNYGEGHAARIDWQSAQVYEKLDGSLITMYWYGGKWHIASSGTPDAGGEIWGSGRTLADMFWEAWRKAGYMLPSALFMDYSFMFEFCSPYNRVVVRYDEPQIVLHGIRRNYDGREARLDFIAARMDWPLAKSFKLNSIDDILQAAKELKPLEQEGYVVVDKGFNRVKIKSPAYVALAHLKDGFSQRRIMELVRSNEGDEFLNYFPEFRADYDMVARAYRRLTELTVEAFESIRHRESQKEFALGATQYPFSGALFALRAGKYSSIEEFYQQVPADRLLQLCGIKEKV